MEYDINEILSIQQRNSRKNSWKEVEDKIGIKFPKDYKMFINLYGEGGINEFLWILSPFSKNEYLNSMEKFKVMKESYNSMKQEFPKQFLFDFYDGQNGLFPWGVTDNGDELFWNYNDGTIEIIVYGSRYLDNEKYLMTMEEFLYKLLKRNIICPLFPDDFILDTNYYENIYM